LRDGGKTRVPTSTAGLTPGRLCSVAPRGQK
jgi:hypothetical protein